MHPRPLTNFLVYTNSLLATLNARRVILNAANESRSAETLSLALSLRDLSKNVPRSPVGNQVNTYLLRYPQVFMLVVSLYEHSSRKIYPLKLTPSPTNTYVVIIKKILIRVPRSVIFVTVISYFLVLTSDVPSLAQSRKLSQARPA